MVAPLISIIVTSVFQVTKDDSYQHNRVVLGGRTKRLEPVGLMIEDGGRS